MIRTALKGVAAHKLRMAMTAVAIVLGVAFVSGSLVFTDTIEARFDNLFSDVYAGVDATVRAEVDDFGTPGGTTQGSLPESLTEVVASVDGVERAVPTVAGVAQLIDRDGNPIGGQGPPTLGGSWVDVPALSALRIQEGNGRPPAGPGEVVIDVATADTQGLAPGDRVGIQVATGVEEFTVVGLASFGSEDNLAGATMSVFSFEEAQRLFDLEGRVTQIDVLAVPGIDQETIVGRLSAALPAGTEAVTGAQQTQEQLDAFSEGLGFLSTALLAFAAVAVFVGAFLIQNTFRIVVAQRTRELALLRALGSSARQVVGMVLVEALAVAVVASGIGVVAGIGFSQLLKTAMDAVGFGMPDGPLTVRAATVIVGMTVGVLVTLTSALLPALRAARIPPVAAMKDLPAGRASLRTRGLVGAGLAAAGAAAIGAGLMAESGAGLTLVGAGAAVAFLGVSVLAPLFARPIAGILGAPLRGLTGTLARENTRRQPRRTAATASALMIGVGLVAFVAIFGASIKASVTNTLERSFPADLAVQSTNLGAGVSPTALERLAGLDEIETLSAVRAGHIKIDGEPLNVAGVDGTTIDAVYTTGASIDLRRFDDGILVQEDLLAEHGWTVGQTIPVEYPIAGTAPTAIVGTFTDQTFANYLLPEASFLERVGSTDPMLVLARLGDQVDIESGRAAVATALAAFPGLDINTASEQIAEAEAQVDQMLALFSGLLGLAVVIAVVGIANTLALSIVERTREIGLLRAIGLGRGGVRSMVRWEAVITALFGAVLGVAVGTGLGWSVVASLADDGLGTFSLPGTSLAVWLGIAAIAGVVASVGPARRAARMNVLAAIAYE